MVITFWTDGIRVQNGLLTYDSFDLEGSGDWIHQHGNRERIRNLTWAVVHLNGLVRPVMTVAQDTSSVPRRIRERFPLPNTWMRILELNEETGEFRASSAEQTQGRVDGS